MNALTGLLLLALLPWRADADDAMETMAATQICQRVTSLLSERDAAWQLLDLDELAAYCAATRLPLAAWQCAETRIAHGDKPQEAGRKCGFNAPPGALAALLAVETESPSTQ